MVIKKILLLLIFLLSSNVSSFEVNDYETEILINKLINKVKAVNNINTNLNFSIYTDDRINAFVNENKKIFISSALVENSSNYVALLSVLAHEIGHIEMNHVELRKDSISKLSNYKNLGNISIIAGAMIFGNFELGNTFIANELAIRNIYSAFSQEQEIEADIYSIETLNKLKLSPDSTLELLNKLEKYSQSVSEQNYEQNFISHPLFPIRKNIIEENRQKDNFFDSKLNNEFLYVKAKFIGHNQKTDLLDELDNPQRLYAEAILEAKKGDIEESLKKINSVLKKERNNMHLLETKGDILLSFGYTKEALKFYNKNLEFFPKNQYVQFRIFKNIDLIKYKEENIKNLFDDNLNLLLNYYNNKYILLKYLEISKRLNKVEWYNFLFFWTNKDKFEDELILKNLNEFINTNDDGLKSLINIIKKSYL